MSADTPHLVKRYSKYKLGNGQFTHDEDADRLFPTKAEADSYAATADGMTGDTYYRYEVSPATTTASHTTEFESRLASLKYFCDTIYKSSHRGVRDVANIVTKIADGELACKAGEIRLPQKAESLSDRLTSVHSFCSRVRESSSLEGVKAVIRTVTQIAYGNLVCGPDRVCVPRSREERSVAKAKAFEAEYGPSLNAQAKALEVAYEGGPKTVRQTLPSSSRS